MREGEFLVGEVDRAPLLAPADTAGLAPRALMAFPGEADDFRFQELLDGLEADGDQGLDEGDLRVEALHCRRIPQPAQPDVFHLARCRHSEYSVHGAAPCCVGWWSFWRNALNHTGAASSIFNYE